jgi:hypothetical protein
LNSESNDKRIGILGQVLDNAHVAALELDHLAGNASLLAILLGRYGTGSWVDFSLGVGHVAQIDFTIEILRESRSTIPAVKLSPLALACSLCISS